MTNDTSIHSPYNTVVNLYGDLNDNNLKDCLYLNHTSTLNHKLLHERFDRSFFNKIDPDIYLKSNDKNCSPY